MDVKAPLNAKRYGEICGIDERFAERTVENIKGILSIKEKRIEVKTTVYKEFVLGESKKICPRISIGSYSRETMKDIAKILSKDRKNI
jgi:hypothetical protein